MNQDKIKSLATQLSESLETITRTNGDKIIALVKDHPKWMGSVCHDCHQGLINMFPDDHRYRFIAEAAYLIAGHDSLDDARDSIEPDIYYHEIYSWLASRVDRSCYVDQASEELGRPEGVDAELSQGQWMEKLEVFDLLVLALDELEDTTELGQSLIQAANEALE